MLAVLCSFFLVAVVSGQTDNCDKMCTDDYQPVCGTDYHTYKIVCEGKELCVEIGTVPAVPVEITGCDNLGMVYSLLVGPSVGGDVLNLARCRSREISNLCNLGVAECKARLSHHYLSILSNGPCTVSHHGGQVNPGGQINPVGLLSDNCDMICDDEVNDGEVCATDGKTYANHCEFNNARCLAQRKHIYLTVRHTGACTDKDVFCPLSCDHNDISPVCSARNTTYRNACYLEQIRCRYTKIPSFAAGFEVAHNGSCDGSDPKVTHKLDCSPYEDTSLIAVEGGHHLSLSTCHRTYRPVCGADYRTHTNACYYCKSMMSQNKVAADHSVPVIFDTACPSYLVSHVTIPNQIG